MYKRRFVAYSFNKFKYFKSSFYQIHAFQLYTLRVIYKLLLNSFSQTVNTVFNR